MNDFHDLPEEERNEWEERAKAVGWEPLENFRGDPDRHIDPRSFVERADKSMGMLRQNNEKLNETNEQLRASLEEVKKSTREILDFNKKQVAESQKNAYEKARADLLAEQRKAVEEGDTDLFDNVEKRKEALEKTKPDPEQEEEKKPYQTPSESDDFKTFQSENPWYSSDKDMRILADSVGASLRDEGDRREGKAFFDAVVSKVKEIRPDKFTNEKREEPSDVADYGSNHGPGNKSKSFASLPKEAKDAFSSLVRQGIYTKEEANDYAKEYYNQ